MKKSVLILQIILGVLLIVFGANKFIGFLPPPPNMPESAQALMGALAGSYIMPLVGIVEVLVGLLLVIRKYVPLALIILAPISVNIVFFHATLDIANIAPALVVAILNLFLVYKNWASFKGLFG